MPEDKRDEIYYPPKGVYFRLYNPNSDQCIFARKDRVGAVNRRYPVYDDQLFTWVQFPRDGKNYLVNKIGLQLMASTFDDGWITATTPDGVFYDNG